MDFENQALLLYKMGFPDDSEEFAKEFIKRYFKKNCRYTVKDGKIISMLFLFECLLYVNSRAYSASYLYAAATLPEMRGKGEMRQLIERVKREEIEKGRIIVTRPADEYLFSFYKKLGFKTAFYYDEYVYSAKGADAPELEEISSAEYYKKREELLKEIPHLTLKETKEFAVSDMLLLGGDGICCAVDLSEETPLVYEFLSEMDNGEEAVLRYIGKDTAVFKGRGMKTPFAMLLSYDEDIELPNRMYMGIAME